MVCIGNVAGLKPNLQKCKEKQIVRLKANLRTEIQGTAIAGLKANLSEMFIAQKKGKRYRFITIVGVGPCACPGA